jgi:ATP-dependent Clp protease ATP-binding subunit ClpA
MFERFDKDSRAVVVQAREEVRRLGDPAVEAEHLLLILARLSDGDAGRVLAESGLTHDGVRDALDAARRRSLDVAGVGGAIVALAEQPPPLVGEPRWGTSAKRALQRAARSAQSRGDRSLRPTHLLLGVLSANEGTVSRAVAETGVDRNALVARAEEALGAPR